MAAAADRYQVPLLAPMLVGVVPTERKLRETLDVPDMVYEFRRISSAANLAVSVIVPENRGGQLPPFAADIERVNITGIDQAQEPLQESLSHRQNKRGHDRNDKSSQSWPHGL